MLAKRIREQLFSTGLIERVDLNSLEKVGRDELGAWLETVIADGWSVERIAKHLGIKPYEVGTLISRYVDRDRLARLFTVQKLMLRASVLGKAELLAKQLEGILNDPKSSNGEKIKAAEVLAKIADLKDITIDGVDGNVEEDDNQSPQILERLEVLQELIGTEVEGSTGASEDSPELEREQEVTGRS